MDNVSISQQPEKKDSTLKDIVVFAILALVIIVPIRTFIAEPFIVKGPSMDTTFADNQYLIVDQLSYHFTAPARGDVIIFKYPNDPSIYYIKRIIGLPGETVSSTNGKITITNAAHPEGFTLSEPYIETGHEAHDSFSKTLSSTDYFVMGDNRSESSDSRAWGLLDRKFFVGRPFVRLYPLTKISVFPGRDTHEAADATYTSVPPATTNPAANPSATTSSKPKSVIINTNI